MATITWQNSAGSLGNYPAGTNIALQFVALSDDLTSVVNYKLLSGSLPTGTKSSPVEITLPGYLSGTFASTSQVTTHNFTIRAFDQFGNIRDRSFSISVSPAFAPTFDDVPAKIISTYDSTWVDYSVQYSNPNTSNQVHITLTSGNLPPGMFLLDGRIQGYANPPTLSNNTPIIKTYLFTLLLSSELGNDSRTYSIEVINQRLVKPPHSRIPTIYNNRPLDVVELTDPYYGFYLTDNTIPTVHANEYFTFKILGHDFDNDTLVYSFGSLPPGLIGDSDTGWITGIPVMDNDGINDYTFTVSVSKENRPLIASQSFIFKLKVVNGIKEDIVWTTPEDLGVIYNNTVCELTVNATSSHNLIYSFADGTLPANLYVVDSGAISGRVAYQPTSTKLDINDETEFVFTVQAYSEDYPKLRSFKTFKLTVKQYYSAPVETVYFKISPSLRGKTVLNSLLTNTSLIPTSYLYRADDPFFGKSSNIKIVQSYGIPSSSITDYFSAIETNYYHRDITLGELKTAIARDDNGDTIYEVVYAEIVDDLVNSAGESIPESIKWERPINLNLGPWTVNNTDIHASYSFNDTYYTSLDPGSVEVLYPASLDNMRNVLINNLGQNTDSNLLPKWMTSQQRNGNTIGFVKCWVICYTLPNKSDLIKSNIENDWNYALGDIDCTIDRLYVDKSSTYNWNTSLLVPAWSELPSEITNPTNSEQHDLVVIFPRKTILPK